VADKRPAVSVRSVNCPNCGAATTVRTFGHAVNVVCMSCRSILDAKDAGVTILQKYRDQVPQEPLIPLGIRGTLPGETIQREVVGFQVREIVVDGISYQWREYLLFNPYHSFRYLTEYAGHWNVVSTLRSLPDGDHMPGDSGTRGFDGEQFGHFQTAIATTVFVLGEFPWQVRVGDQVTAVDYVAPPRMLSAEVTSDKEVTWSLGQYTTGDEIWKGLGLPGSAPLAEGVFADQPSPYVTATRRMWRNAAWLLAVATLLWIFHLASARSRQVFTQAFRYDARQIQDASLVTPIFEIDGGPSAVRVETQTDLDNQWMGVGYALVNDDTGQSFEFAREVSFYAGVEDGESWTEGSRTDSVTLPTIPPGHYFLRIEPEGERIGKPVDYRVNVIEDVTTSLWYVVTVILVMIPPIVTSIRASGFESRRWAESDHGSSGSSNQDADDDDGDEGDDD
jgi:ribosomal protein S27E